MKRWICGVLCVLMVLMSAVAAAGARMPALRGALTDDADVLSTDVSAALTEYAEDVEDETDVEVHVAIVHFLDGLDAQTYANELFAHWKLSDNAVLLLCAAGEDSFATAVGSKAESKLGKQNLDNLMYTSSDFATLIAAQQYDAAFGKYFIAFNDLLNKRYDEKLKLPKALAAYDGNTAVQQNPVSSLMGAGYHLWSEVMDNVNDNSAHYNDYHANRDQQDNGLGVGGWIVLIILVMIIFSQSTPVRKARNQGKGNYRRIGCGCSPLGWILSLFGINALIDALRGKR